MVFKILQKKLYFYIIQFIAIIIWAVPMIQKPLKVALLLFLFYLSIYFALKLRKVLTNIIIPTIGCFLLFLSGYNGGYQSSLINIALSFYIIPLCPIIVKPFTPKQICIAKKIASFICICMFIQLCIYQVEGRPSLAYEINLGAAYLFLFFIYSKYIKFKIGQIFVIIASLLILSRLLIFAILLYYIANYGTKLLPQNFKLNWRFVQTISYILFFVFNVFFLTNFTQGEAYDNSINRVSNLNDGSNMLRFRINIKILDGLFSDKQLKFGYGQITAGHSDSYTQYYENMPHNELLDGIAEFGYIFMIFSWLFSSYYLSKVFVKINYKLFFPLLLYTLILWVRFLIIPSLEMFLIYSILIMNKNEKNSAG